MSRWSVYRCSAHASALVAAVAGAAVLSALLAAPAAAGTTGVSVKVTPDWGLVNGQVVTVSGRGLAHAGSGKGLTWFVTECTAAVKHRLDPSTDTPHCDVTHAKAIRVSHNGTFSAKFRVRAGIIGDGYCGTDGHTTCVIGVSTAEGQGRVVKIAFVTPAATTTTSTTAA
jgi:hypothetical protein